MKEPAGGSSLHFLLHLYVSVFICDKTIILIEQSLVKFAYLSSEWAKSSYHCGVTYRVYQRQHEAQLPKKKNWIFEDEQ